MKFLLISPRFHTNLYYRVKALEKAGHEVYIAVLYKGKSEFYKDVEVHILKSSFITRLVGKIAPFFKKRYLKSSFENRIQTPDKSLRKLIKAFSPDFIILKAFQNLLAVKTLLLAKFSGIDVLMLTQTNINHIKGSKFLFKLNLKIFNKLNVLAYITPIKINYDKFIEVGIKNVFYIPFVFESLTNIPNKKLSPIKIVSIGKFIRRKEHLLISEAVHKLKDKYKIHLIIIGENVEKDYYKEVNDFINNNNLSKVISIKTNISYTEVMKIYNSCNIFVLPAFGEPAGYSPVEALAHGIPVIISSNSGTNCYIKNDYNGYIFEEKNVNDLANKIEVLLSNTNKLEKISKNALISAKENHSLECFYKKINEVIKFSYN